MHTMREETPGSLTQVLDAHNENRKFQGDPLTGKTADLTGRLPTEPEEPEDFALGGHPVQESGEPGSDMEEKPPRQTFVYGSREAAEEAALETERAASRLRAELDEVKNLTYQALFPQDQGQGRPPTETPETPYGFASQRRKQVMDEIEEFDPYD